MASRGFPVFLCLLPAPALLGPSLTESLLAWGEAVLGSPSKRLAFTEEGSDCRKLDRCALSPRWLPATDWWVSDSEIINHEHTCAAKSSIH